uniref:Uncharacterized protein n=1 Tax=Ciona intestinalis TaxID=7719 RepID=H2XX00_CIOIN
SPVPSVFIGGGDVCSWDWLDGRLGPILLNLLGSPFWLGSFNLQFLLVFLLCCHLFILFNLFCISVEVKIAHHVPGLGSWDGSSQTEDFSCKKPPHEADRVLGLVVAWDADVDISDRRIGVAQSDQRDVHVG